VLDYFAAGVDFAVVARPGWMLPSEIKYAAAVVLIAVLGYAIVGKALSRGHEQDPPASESSSDGR
jgi:hypothetical protein